MDDIKNLIDILYKIKTSHNNIEKRDLLKELPYLVKDIQDKEMGEIIKNDDDYSSLFKELLYSDYSELIYEKLYNYVSRNYSYSKLKGVYGFKKDYEDFEICIVPEYKYMEEYYSIKIIYENGISFELHKDGEDIPLLLYNIENISKELLNVLKERVSYFDGKEIHLINKEKLLKKFSNIKIIPNNMIFTVADAVIDEKKFKLYIPVLNEKSIQNIQQYWIDSYNIECYVVFGENYEIATIYFNVKNMKDVNKALGFSRKINKILNKII